MNKLILTGNLTRDPEMRETQNGTKVCTFTLTGKARVITRRRTISG